MCHVISIPIMEDGERAPCPTVNLFSCLRYLNGPCPVRAFRFVVALSNTVSATAQTRGGSALARFASSKSIASMATSWSPRVTHDPAQYSENLKHPLSMIVSNEGNEEHNSTC